MCIRDRYYQLARCMRDEDLRADRQFEFTQLDAEASFVDAEDVLAFISEAVLAATKAVRPEDAPGQIPRMTWREAQDRFGTDKPDLRFGMELADLTAVFATTAFRAFQPPAAVKGIVVAGKGDLNRAALDRLTDRAKGAGAAGLVWMRVTAGGGLDSPVAKFLSGEEQAGVVGGLGAAAGDLVLIVAGDERMVNHVLLSLIHI